MDTNDIKIKLEDGHWTNAMYAHKRIMKHIDECALPECSTSYADGVISAISYDENELILTVKNKQELINLKN